MAFEPMSWCDEEDMIIIEVEERLLKGARLPNEDCLRSLPMAFKVYRT